MILRVERRDGVRRAIPLDLAAGADVSVQVVEGGYAEALQLAKLSGVELDADDVNPSLRLIEGEYQRIIPLSPARSRPVARSRRLRTRSPSPLTPPEVDERFGLSCR